MKENIKFINGHYGTIDISARILKALKDSGKNLNNLKRDDLASFDEFHTGGKESTVALAELAGISSGMRVLDIGSGVGGPARTLADDFGCLVSGLDLTFEFCRAASMLTRMVGLSAKVNFQYGDAMELPYTRHSFNCVWSQNTLMNIQDKEKLLKEVNRVLMPEGLFVFESVLAGKVPGMVYPSFWASSEEMNFLISEDELKILLQKSGFKELKWIDNTADISRKAVNRVKNLKMDNTRLTGRSIIVEKDVESKIRNSVLNFQNNYVISTSAVYRKHF